MPPKKLVRDMNDFIWETKQHQHGTEIVPSKRDLLLCELRLDDPKVVSDLLDRGVLAPNSRIGLGRRKLTLLDYATCIQSRALLRLLLDRGSDPRHGSFFQYCVSEATDAGDAVMLKLLLEHGGNAEGRSRRPLWSAARQNRLDLVKLLLDHGANPNHSQGMRAGLRAIHLAALHGNVKMVNTLVEHGAQVNPAVFYVDSKVPEGLQVGDRPLSIAIRAGKDACARRLVELGARG